MAQTSHVVARPREIHSVRVNLDKGIQMFPRFNRQPPTPDFTWPAVGPET